MKSQLIGIACATVVGLVLGLGLTFVGKPLLHIYAQSQSVIDAGEISFFYVAAPYFLCGIMDVASGGLRGLGYSFLSAVITLFGACVFRVWWVFEIFPHYRTMENLLLSYPISWLLVAILNSTLLYWVCRRLFRAQRWKGGRLGGAKRPAV